MHYREFDIRVEGGTLHVGQWGEGPLLVVAAHGLAGNHLHFAALAAQLGDAVTVVAPDLRGRGASRDITGPFGMAAHADDLAAVLDHLGAEDAVVVGHSMGGFVAVVAADRHPDRVRDTILVDGGLPLDLAHLAGQDIEAVVRAVTGPVLDRLRTSYPSVDAYLDSVRVHPALAQWTGYMESAYRYDLIGEAASLLTSSVRAQAVLDDSASELRSGDVERALGRLTRPTVLVRAELGMFNQAPPLYPDALVAETRARVPELTDVVIPGVNHYTILLTDTGAAAVADVLRDRQPKP